MPRSKAAAVSISDGQDVPAQMQESKARHSGLARDDEKSGDTMQESRPAHPATAPSEIEPIPVSDGELLQVSPLAEIDLSVTLDRSPSESHIHEIFHYARKLSAEARTFIPDYPGIYQAMLDPNAPRALETDPVWADDPPLFLQKREA